MAKGDKYIDLDLFLQNNTSDTLKLSFLEIEKIVGFELPNSAYEHEAFWANSRSHSIAHAWLDNNFKVIERNKEDHYIIFERVRK